MNTIVIKKMHGDATVFFYKGGLLVYSEGLYGKTESNYQRSIPTWVEWDSHLAIWTGGEFEYEVVCIPDEALVDYPYKTELIHVTIPQESFHR